VSAWLITSFAEVGGFVAERESVGLAAADDAAGTCSVRSNPPHATSPRDMSTAVSRRPHVMKLDRIERNRSTDDQSTGRLWS
jgi:hypothetical protein